MIVRVYEIDEITYENYIQFARLFIEKKIVLRDEFCQLKAMLHAVTLVNDPNLFCCYINITRDKSELAILEELESATRDLPKCEDDAVQLEREIYKMDTQIKERTERAEKMIYRHQDLSMLISYTKIFWSTKKKK